MIFLSNCCNWCYGFDADGWRIGRKRRSRYYVPNTTAHNPSTRKEGFDGNVLILRRIYLTEKTDALNKSLKVKNSIHGIAEWIMTWN